MCLFQAPIDPSFAPSSAPSSSIVNLRWEYTFAETDVDLIFPFRDELKSALLRVLDLPPTNTIAILLTQSASDVLAEYILLGTEETAAIIDHPLVTQT